MELYWFLSSVAGDNQCHSNLTGGGGGGTCSTEVHEWMCSKLRCTVSYSCLCSCSAQTIYTQPSQGTQLLFFLFLNLFRMPLACSVSSLSSSSPLFRFFLWLASLISCSHKTHEWRMRKLVVTGPYSEPVKQILQLCSGRFLCAQKSPQALHSISLRFPQQCVFIIAFETVMGPPQSHAKHIKQHILYAYITIIPHIPEGYSLSISPVYNST